MENAIPYPEPKENAIKRKSRKPKTEEQLEAARARMQKAREVRSAKVAERKKGELELKQIKNAYAQEKKTKKDATVKRRVEKQAEIEKEKKKMEKKMKKLAGKFSISYSYSYSGSSSEESSEPQSEPQNVPEPEPEPVPTKKIKKKVLKKTKVQFKKEESSSDVDWDNLLGSSDEGPLTVQPEAPKPKKSLNIAEDFRMAGRPNVSKSTIQTGLAPRQMRVKKTESTKDLSKFF